MQCSGSGFDAGRSGIASTDSDGSGANQVLNRRRCEHRHRREWPVCASSLHGRGMAEPRAHKAHASRPAARCDAVALVLIRAGRASPARTRTAAEPTRCSIAAAVSTDSAHGHTQHTPVGPATEAKRLRCRAVCVCHAVLQQLLEESERCSQMRCSGSGFDAGRSGITSTDSDGS